MKKLLVFAFLLSALVGAGQALPTISGYTNLNQKYQWRGGVFYERLSPPADTTFTKFGYAILPGIAGTWFGNGSWWTKLVSGSGSGYINPLTELGQIIYAETAGVQTALTGNKTTTQKILSQLGDGTNSAPPGWIRPSRYLPAGELPGDNIVALGNGFDFTNFHTTVTFVDGVVGNGCQVSWTGVGLVFHVNSPCVYNIGGVQYNFPGGDVTLPTADPSDPRFDDIVVTTSTTATYVQGTAQANPEIPDVDQTTQLYLTAVFVDAGATEPTQLGQLIIKDETYSAGAEWFLSRTATIDSLYTAVTAYHLTRSVRLTVAGNNQYFQLNSPAAAVVQKSSFTNLVFHVRNVSALSNPRNFFITLRINGVQVPGSNSVNINAWGYTKSAVGVWQTINIPMSAFGGSDNFNQVRLTNTGTGGTLNVLFDYWTLQSGIVGPPATVYTFVNGLHQVGNQVKWGGPLIDDLTYLPGGGTKSVLFDSVLQYIIKSHTGDGGLAHGNFFLNNQGTTMEWTSQTGDTAFQMSTAEGRAAVGAYRSSISRFNGMELYQDSISFFRRVGVPFDTLTLFMRNLPYGGGFDKTVAYNSATGQLGYSDGSPSGGGGGGGGWALTGTSTLAGNVTIAAATNNITFNDLSNFTVKTTDYPGALIAVQNSGNVWLGDGDGDVNGNAIHIDDAGNAITVLLGTVGTFAYNADYSTNYTSLSLITRGDAPQISTGVIAPASTPIKVGDIYVDITAKKLYFATGTSSSADWTIAN